MTSPLPSSTHLQASGGAYRRPAAASPLVASPPRSQWAERAHPKSHPAHVPIGAFAASLSHGAAAGLEPGFGTVPYKEVDRIILKRPVGGALVPRRYSTGVAKGGVAALESRQRFFDSVNDQKERQYRMVHRPTARLVPSVFMQADAAYARKLEFGGTPWTPASGARRV